MNKLMDLAFGELSAQHMFGDVGGDVFPTQSKMPVIGEVQRFQNLNSLILGQGKLQFISCSVNVQN